MTNTFRKIDCLVSVGIVALCVIAFLSLLFPLYCAHFNVMIGGPNEGWNAYYADAAMGKMPLYPSPDKLITNNYPPLSFYIVGAVGKLMGDNIQAGRLMGFLGLLSVVFFIFKSIRILNGKFEPSILGAAWFLATMGLYFTQYVSRNEPQLLALAIMMGGFFLFLKAVKKGSGYWLPMLVMVVAGFFKHNIVMLPLSGLLWLFFQRDWKALSKCLRFSIFFIVLGFMLCYVCYGSDFFFNLMSPRRFVLRQGGAALIDLGSVALAAIASFIILWKRRRDTVAQLILIVMIIGLMTDFSQRWGTGVDMNSQFDLNIAVALAVGMSFQFLYVLKNNSAQLRQLIFLVLLLLPLLLAPNFSLIGRFFSPTLPQEALWRQNAMLEEITRVKAIPGDVLCAPYVSFKAGKPFTVDEFSLHERIKANKVPPDLVSQRIANHQLTKVTCNPDCKWPWPDGVFYKLKCHFQPFDD